MNGKRKTIVTPYPKAMLAALAALNKEREKQDGAK